MGAVHLFQARRSNMSASSSATLNLLNEARKGDGASLGLLLRNYFRYLNSVSRNHLDVRIGARVSASDIVQETLLEAHRDFGKFSGGSIEEFTGWIRRILFNNLATAIEKHILAGKRDVRKQRSLDQKIGSEDHSRIQLANFLKQDVTSPSAPMQREESLDQLTRAIDRLPPDYQRVIRLRHFEDLSFIEIAEQLERNPGAVRMIWVRAIERLRRQLQIGDSREQ